MKVFKLTDEAAPVADRVFVYTGEVFATQGVTDYTGEELYSDHHEYMISVSQRELRNSHELIVSELVYPILEDYSVFAKDKSKQVFNINFSDLKITDIDNARIIRLTGKGLDIGVRIGDQYCIVRLHQKNAFDAFFD